tara:strand:- start:1221 stop:1883 length:663 start_codon:yes stop_codon:yes gene_type:complete
MSSKLNRFKQLNLKPLNTQTLNPQTLNTSNFDKKSRQFTTNVIHKNWIIYKLKHMNKDDVFKLFQEFDTMPNNDDIHFNVQEIGEYDGRKLVEVDGQKFYKSTGTSRGTHLEGIFLPYDKINRDAYFPQDRRIQKIEDKYILAPLQELLPVKEELIKYGRFINEENAIKSWYLFKLYGFDGGRKRRKQCKSRKSRKQCKSHKTRKSRKSRKSRKQRKQRK